MLTPQMTFVAPISTSTEPSGYRRKLFSILRRRISSLALEFSLILVTSFHIVQHSVIQLIEGFGRSSFRNFEPDEYPRHIYPEKHEKGDRLDFLWNCAAIDEPSVDWVMAIRHLSAFI